jgi:hypothetical protein
VLFAPPMLSAARQPGACCVPLHSHRRQRATGSFGDIARQTRRAGLECCTPPAARAYICLWRRGREVSSGASVICSCCRPGPHSETSGPTHPGIDKDFSWRSLTQNGVLEWFPECQRRRICRVGQGSDLYFGDTTSPPPRARAA